MKKNELTHIIRQIVAEEVRKELPSAIAEVFSNFMGQRQPVREETAPREVQRPPQRKEGDLKMALREMFEGTNVMRSEEEMQAPPQARKFTSNPLINEVLNSTRPFSPMERTGAPAGMAALMAQAGAGVPMGGSAMPVMEEGSDPDFTRRMPDMGTVMPSAASAAPIPHMSQAQLLRDDHVPMEGIPQGASVLDVAPAVSQVNPTVGKALTRNYSQMMKLIDSKKKRV
ncbi:hypothetical protein E2P64_07645 [Candidatus Bathyarchaeota archaeon]|nr:hypothetical protein E2P64_07645 [Candidatus Bathyarchaeota archaeon]